MISFNISFQKILRSSKGIPCIIVDVLMFPLNHEKMINLRITRKKLKFQHQAQYVINHLMFSKSNYSFHFQITLNYTMHFTTINMILSFNIKLIIISNIFQCLTNIFLLTIINNIIPYENLSQIIALLDLDILSFKNCTVILLVCA